MAALLNALIEAGERIEVQYVHGHWRGVNDLDDFRRAGDFAHGQTPFGSNGADRARVIEAAQFVEAARERGFDWYAGVPCSYLTPFINYVLQDESLHYVSAANEGDAVALIAGVTLGARNGRRGIAMMQNSGLGNAVSPLTSLTWTFRLPQLLIVTWRGQPGVADEPQHALMGPVTPAMLDTMEIPWETVPHGSRSDRPGARSRDRAHGRTGRPYALVMQKGSVAPYELKKTAVRAARHERAAARRAASASKASASRA